MTHSNGYEWSTDYQPAHPPGERPQQRTPQFDPMMSGLTGYMNEWARSDVLFTDPWLIARRSPGGINQELPGDRHTRPLDNRYLHRDFAKLETSNDIRDFANMHGRLGLAVLVMNPRGYADDGESLATWEHEIAKMRIAVSLWDAIRNSHMPEAEAEIVRMLSNRGYGITFDPETSDIARGLKYPLIYYAMERQMPQIDEQGRSSWPNSNPDLTTAASWTLCDMINRELGTAVSPVIWPTKKHMFLSVKNLLGAMYVTLSEEVSGTTVSPRRCLHCGRYLKPDLRADAKFCSNLCRKANHISPKSQENKP